MAQPPPLSPPSPPETTLAPLRLSRTLPWVGLLAFSSGVPYALVNDTAPALYTYAGVAKTELGLLSAVGLAWVLKVFLAPLVDRYGSRRTWIVGTQLALALTLVWVSTLPPTHVPTAAWAALGLLAVFSATQDLAVDAYSVEAVPARSLWSSSSVRISVYRIAMVLAGGTLVARSPALGWSGVWWLAAGALGALALTSFWLPGAPRERAQGAPLVEPIRRLVLRPGAWGFLAFVLLFKVGDRAMGPSTKPFLISLNFSPSALGDVVTPAIIVAMLLGAWTGGLLTRRWGVYRALWTLGLLQALSNLGYALAASTASVPVAWGALLFEPFCGGLGSTPFVTVLMLSCDRAHVATQYAFLTALMGLVGGSVAIGWGYLAERFGFAAWFSLSFFIALPAFLLLPQVRRWLVNLPSHAPAPPAPPAPAGNA